MRGVTNQEILEFPGNLGNPEKIGTTNIINATMKTLCFFKK